MPRYAVEVFCLRQGRPVHAALLWGIDAHSPTRAVQKAKRWSAADLRDPIHSFRIEELDAAGKPVRVFRAAADCRVFLEHSGPEAASAEANFARGAKLDTSQRADGSFEEKADSSSPEETHA